MGEIPMTEKQFLQEEQRFMELCDSVIMNRADYGEKARAAKHNNAQTMLNRIANRRAEDRDTAERFFSDLMAHESARARLTGTGYALAKGVCETQALQVLREFASGTDKGAAFHASMSLLAWELESKRKT